MSLAIALDHHLGYLANALGLTEDELAGVLAVSPRTVTRWRAERRLPQTATRQRLDDLEAFVERLHATFKTSDDGRQWVHEQSGYFGGLRPVDALRSGRIDLASSALEALDSGVYL